MTTDDIKLRIAEIRKTAQSPLEVQLQGIGLIAEVLASPSEATGDMVRDIQRFHEKFGLGYSDGPRPLLKDLSDFRIRFMQEELDEYRDAVRTGNLEKQFDALIDLVYVALGTSYMHGFPFPKGWARVQDANMKKVRTKRPTARGGGYDIVKPEGWTPPSLTDLVSSIE